MNLIDHFDASKDTIKRALHKHVIPSIRAWTKSPGDMQDEHTYKILYDGRVYTISPKIFSGAILPSYIVLVTPGATAEQVYLGSAGGEHVAENEEQILSACGSVAQAVERANLHAFRYGMVTM